MPHSSGKAKARKKRAPRKKKAGKEAGSDMTDSKLALHQALGFATAPLNGSEAFVVQLRPAEPGYPDAPPLQDFLDELAAAGNILKATISPPSFMITDFPVWYCSEFFTDPDVDAMVFWDAAEPKTAKLYVGDVNLGLLVYQILRTDPPMFEAVKDVIELPAKESELTDGEWTEHRNRFAHVYFGFRDLLRNLDMAKRGDD